MEQPRATVQRDYGRIRAIAERALADFEFDPDDEDGSTGWKEPFHVARRIQAGLLANGVYPFQVDPDVLLSVAEDFIAEYGISDPDEMPLTFPAAWRAVNCPEGESMLSYAAKCAEIGKWRADVGEGFKDPRLRADAQSIATTVYFLQEFNGRAFLSTRSAAHILNKSNGYAAMLLRRLVKEGVLTGDSESGKRMARHFRYVDPQER